MENNKPKKSSWFSRLTVSKPKEKANDAKPSTVKADTNKPLNNWIKENHSSANGNQLNGSANNQNNNNNRGPNGINAAGGGNSNTLPAKQVNGGQRVRFETDNMRINTDFGKVAGIEEVNVEDDDDDDDEDEDEGDEGEDENTGEEDEGDEEDEEGSGGSGSESGSSSSGSSGSYSSSSESDDDDEEGEGDEAAAAGGGGGAASHKHKHKSHTPSQYAMDLGGQKFHIHSRVHKLNAHIGGELGIAGAGGNGNGNILEDESESEFDDDEEDNEPEDAEEGATILSVEDRHLARLVFKYFHSISDKKLGLDFEEASAATAMLGQTIKMKQLKEAFDEAAKTQQPVLNSSTVDYAHLSSPDAFINMLGLIRAGHETYDKINADVKKAFDAMYDITCPTGSQVESGQKYILASDLRKIMLNYGDDVLTDMQADEMIDECHPIYTVDGTGRKIGKIFLEQYSAMLTDGSV